MGSIFSSPLGGVSKVFPVGTFVRFPRQLTAQEIKDAEKDGDLPGGWDSAMHETVGRIGIVLGGGAKQEQNIAKVGFIIANESILGNYFYYKSSWLEKVQVISIKEENWLRKYLRYQMRLLLEHKMKFYKENSELGPVGTFVRVNWSPITPPDWPFDQIPTMNKIGVVVGATNNTETRVVFPEPIYYTFVYDNSKLTTIESIDNITMLATEFNALYVLKKLVLKVSIFKPLNESTDSDTDSENEDSDSDSENTKIQTVINARMDERVQELEKKVKQLEMGLVKLESD